MNANPPTIYEALRDKLGSEPTHTELCNDVRRIIGKPSVEEEVKARNEIMKYRRSLEK